MSFNDILTKHGNAVRSLAGINNKMTIDDMTQVLQNIERLNINLGGHAMDLDNPGTTPSIDFVAQNPKDLGPWITTSDAHVPVNGRRWLVFSTAKEDIRRWQIALSDVPVEMFARCWSDGNWGDWAKLGGGN